MLIGEVYWEGWDVIKRRGVEEYAIRRRGVKTPFILIPCLEEEGSRAGEPRLRKTLERRKESCISGWSLCHRYEESEWYSCALSKVNSEGWRMFLESELVRIHGCVCHRSVMGRRHGHEGEGCDRVWLSVCNQLH